MNNKINPGSKIVFDGKIYMLMCTEMKDNGQYTMRLADAITTLPFGTGKDFSNMKLTHNQMNELVGHNNWSIAV